MPFLLIAILVLALAAPAAAAEPTVNASPLLWSTVNICDTKSNPDTLGVRASMPGSGRRSEQMFMRFRAQFFSEVDNRWHNFLSKGTDSGFIRVGSARFRARQSGWTFPFAMNAGQRYELRGVVNFEWRRRGRVVRRAVERTTGGHRTSVGDPRGFTAATCVITG